VNEIEKILYYVKYVLVNPVTEPQKKEVFAQLEKDYKAKLDELQEAFDKEAKESNKSKNDLEKLLADNKSALEKEFNRIKSIVANLKV